MWLKPRSTALESHLTATPASPLTAISPEEIVKLQGANENSPRNREIKVRMNEMKVRKKDFKVPKNLFVPHWIFRKLHRGIVRFP